MLIGILPIFVADTEKIYGCNFVASLSVIWVGFLGVLFEVCVCLEGAQHYPSPSPCLKLVRIMLESWNLARKYTHPYVVSENIPYSTKVFLILLMPAFFSKNQRFLAKIVPLHKAIVWQLC